MAGRIRAVTRAAVIGGALVAATFALPPTGASAALGGCSTDIIGERTGTAYCSLVTEGSHFRVKVWCYKYTTGALRILYGPWRYTATQSAATCPIGEYVGNVANDKVF